MKVTIHPVLGRADLYLVRDDAGDSTTQSTFTNCLQWAACALDEVGDEVTIVLGEPRTL